ncbi:hypothetical protein GCM10012275_01470 [Longimycelium tulufanense]|uniref:Uncharacterized protein n=1 Tax=Longimycelium tulufanense TaxID=907463 RepID=A0A8J3FSB8_9PSEU|nr:hypothetical protein [Longimycelium tulufanense]GGM33779.1 hypothetical protein GCM10012275_01470 [Longimycelium tulufanense]
MSDAIPHLIEHLVELRRRQWTFVRTDPGDPDSPILGRYLWPPRLNAVDTLTLLSHRECVAMRLRVSDATDINPAASPPLLWGRAGTPADVLAALLDLPAPDAPTAPRLTLPRPELWTPSSAS